MTDHSAVSNDSGPNLVKISELTPASKKFNLLFELIEISSRDNTNLHCRVVDDTGIANACFNHYSEKLEAGVVYHMTNLKCKVVNSHLQIQMSYCLSYLESLLRLPKNQIALDSETRQMIFQKNSMPQNKSCKKFPKSTSNQLQIEEETN